jgi:hypothetical protein
MDGNGLGSYGIRFGYHLLLHFDSNTNTDMDIFEYKYKIGVLESYREGKDMILWAS